ncbi:MAG: tetrahydrofolate dehydrogenase/cyclohydrolase catalytic domain-containing protein [Candidatus Uhrbacteria bacterium]|nr:bifunctional methylenetetrahydrofolate dehydrogenase/methenyltetrahydrofolate cyclohydrolase [Patescibacteria group bacterium]MBU1907283.1 bifunctional methylenetetrahydrofolate dehydrogenase/methenyltetrahydrofolate cyclohydrolase [Patescibacteria group bacterium]
MAQIIDGKRLAEKIRAEVKQRIESTQTRPGLAVLLVGSDPASHTYVGIKEKACAEVGINSEKYLYFASEPEEKLIAKIEELNARADIHGILVQLPLPEQDEDKIIAAIDPAKDVDGFHPKNIMRLDDGNPLRVSPVALGIMKMIESTGRPIAGLKAVVVASELFAHPIVKLLQDQDVETEVVRPADPELAEKTKTADILVTAVGKPGLITGEMIREGAIVIDIGTTKVEGKIKGDVDFESASEVAGWISPVPGGVGPMTVAYLLVNVLKSATH